MARTTYPGLTKTENARSAKYDYHVATDAEKRICIVLQDDWCVVSRGKDGGVKEDYHVYRVKDAHTGALVDVDTRKGGSVERRAPFSPTGV